VTSAALPARQPTPALPPAAPPYTWEWPRPLLTGTLVRRYQRFLADVTLDDGSTVTAHCPNTGSMTGCAEPGSPVLLSESDNPDRKLRHTWEAVRMTGADGAPGAWVGIHTGHGPAIVAAGIRTGAIPELAGYARLRREVPYGTGSRIDLLLEDDHRPPCYVEVKNVTLTDDDTALFPDAVTTRGARHMRELERVVAEGGRAAVLFLVHRADCVRFAPAGHIDPAYAAALAQAVRGGVLVLPCAARVTPHGVTLLGRLPEATP